VREYKTEQFPTFTDALQSYTRENQLSTAGLPIGLAVAGVTRGDTITLPNCRWYLSVSGIKSFVAREPLVLNDFESIAWSLAGIAPGRLKPVGSAPPRAVEPGRTFLVVGTGPGLGTAVLAIGADGLPTVFAGEGGHSSFSPQNADEDALLAALRARHGHVSFERLLANFGLQNIYGFVGEQQGRKSEPPAAETIVAAAQRADAQARAAVDLFTAILGSFVGNMVLATGTFDGVFLVSPLLGQMLPFLGDGRFRAAFVAKGRMRKAMETVPIAFADQHQARLEGVAAAMRARKG
jgi:glucokinase